jgi:hypothetical protein
VLQVPEMICRGEPEDVIEESVRQMFLENLRTNLGQKSPSRRRYNEATYEMAFLIRTASRKAYDILRQFIPLPRTDLVDEHFKGEVTECEKNLTSLDGASRRLENFKGELLKKSNPFVEREGKKVIPSILGADSMAIEPYQTPSGKMAYQFVYLLMPLDHNLDESVISVVAKANGNAQDTKKHFRELKKKCEENGFLIAGLAGDGDTAYGEFLEQCYEVINEKREASFTEIVDSMRNVETLFTTDFLHFMKCLRNRFVGHKLSIYSCCSSIVAMELGEILGSDEYLKPNNLSSQLRDSIPLNLFTLSNILKLIRNGKYQAATYFLPIVLWRLAIQAHNITRETRI